MKGNIQKKQFNTLHYLELPIGMRGFPNGICDLLASAGRRNHDPGNQNQDLSPWESARGSSSPLLALTSVAPVTMRNALHFYCKVFSYDIARSRIDHAP